MKGIAMEKLCNSLFGINEAYGVIIGGYMCFCYRVII